MNPHLCGAKWSPEETAAAQDAFAADGVATSRPDLIGWRDGETVCLWDAEQSLFKRLLSTWIQSIGTCVGMGMGRAMQDSIYNAIETDQYGFPVAVAWEPTYAIARVARDIGNGQMGSDPDGNYPSWFARALRFYGVASRRQYGTIDLSRQREDLAARWCVRGSAVPQAIIDENKAWPASACFWPRTEDEVLGCLRAGYGIARATDRATNPKRGKTGYSGLIPSGGHCQCWRGVIVDKHGEPFVAEQQSWPGTQAPHGEYDLEDVSGRQIVLPEGVGLISMNDVRYCLKNGEVIAVACPETLWRQAA